MQVTVPQLVLAILSAMGAFAFFLFKENLRGVNARLKKNEDAINALTKQANEFKINYLDRFVEVNKNINELKDEVIKEIRLLEKK